jgi:16S rRNA (guanine527-N7)-methyltransferase
MEAALELARIQLSVEGCRQLADLAEWVRREAIPAGGVGPLEGPKLEERHLADSVLFAAAWEGSPRQCWDLGAGVGLPGLVLAIVWPDTEMVLVDRSAKRCDLARRAARLIGVNVTVCQEDWNARKGTVEAIVSRAAAPAQTLRPTLQRLLEPGGLAVVSGTGDRIEGFEPLELPAGSFDHPSRLLIMRST